MDRSIEESNAERAMIRDAVAAVAAAVGNVWIPCPDERCHWGISDKDRSEAETVMAYHLATDPRHTGEEWTDRDGRDRIGFDYI